MKSDELWDTANPTFSFEVGMFGNDVDFEAAISDDVYLELEELDADDGTCQVSGTAIDGGQAMVLGYVGPYEGDDDGEFSCGALVRISHA